MTQAAIDYATSLRKTETPKELLQQVKDVLEAVPQVRSEFEDPTVSIEKKHLIIDRVFPKEIRDFLKILCDNISGCLMKYAQLMMNLEESLKQKKIRHS